ncbi:MAG: polyprenol monophosphomannose synthase [Acidobacteria bacterium]|nr:polyprenol monophosphomannose synthase [Acidobacteriota bacterium]MCI0624581.1 polyprenol monophosphomannose synthase [Acidobacteriota bacterium]
MRQTFRPLIILPTYNERESLGRLIPEILKIDSRLHVLVVDDSSPDDTAGLVRQLISTALGTRLFLETRVAKLGLASAYVHGFGWGLARGYDFLIEMDADWSHQPKYLTQMLALAPETDFVIGSRYVSGGGTLNWGLGRKILSWGGSLYSQLLLGVNIADFTGGFNGWHADVLPSVCIESIQSEGYSFQIELKYRASQLGFRHIEFPIIFDERRAGQSKMSAAIALEAIWRVWAFRWNRNAILARCHSRLHSAEREVHP